jgi:hypothetical protein
MTATTQTVRDIALEQPSSIRVFEQYGIDYCCGGRKPLAEACARSERDTTLSGRLYIARLCGLVGDACSLFAASASVAGASGQPALDQYLGKWVTVRNPG